MLNNEPSHRSLSITLLSIVTFIVMCAIPLVSVGQTPPIATKPPNLSGDAEEELPFDRKAPPKHTGSNAPASTPGVKTPQNDTSIQPQSADVYDILYLESQQGSPRQIPIRLSQEYLQAPFQNTLDEKLYKFNRVTQSGSAKLTIRGSEVAGLQYYEQRMGEKAARILGLASYGILCDHTCRIAHDVDLDTLRQAEQVLESALSQHDSSVGPGVRVGPNWQTKIRRPLIDAIFAVRLGRIDSHFRDQQYVEAWAGCEQLASTSDREGPSWDKLRLRFEKVFHARSEAAIKRADYRDVRRLLEERAKQLGNDSSETASRMKERLMAEAGKLMRQAESKQVASPKEAITLINAAADIWPTLPGLDPLRRKLADSHAVLQVAYRDLPHRISILRPRTFPERHVVSLIHESLVAWNDNPYSGGRFEGRLAEEAPGLLKRGRVFRLSARYWNDASDGRIPCTIEDVRWTLKLLTDPNRLGYSPAAARLLSGVENVSDGDPRKLVIRLNRDFWQPLAVMNFPILRCPEVSAPVNIGTETPGLIHFPSGAGPYRYVPDESSETVRLVAKSDPNAVESPRIREIVFHRMEPAAAVKGVLAGKIDLIHDLSASQVTALREQGISVKRYSVPSVWILAPNYRNALLRNRNLRMSLTHSIDRESILDDCFRPKGSLRDHAVLTGPYPADSWACPEEVSAHTGTNESVFDTRRRQAIGYAESARRELHREKISLSLLYPTGNESVHRACQQITLDAGSLDILLNPVGLPPTEFYNRVVQQHQYDLAYWRYDFEKPVYCLESLLDSDSRAQRSGGPNFLGYTQDETLAGLFSELKRHKHFPTIRRLKHEVHRYVAQNAIVIPLWQLDTYLAVSGRLHPRDQDGKPRKLDPCELFRDINYWEMDPKK